MAKLTLSVDAGVVSRAKRSARQRGTSVSKMVEAFLDSASDPGQPKDQPPILRSLRGILKAGDAAAYGKHLREKYR
jgi:hypothetical protein